MRTCSQCSFFAPIKGHKDGAGVCCVNPPTPYPAMGQASMVRMPTPQPQNVTIGLDPPVAADRIACRRYLFAAVLPS